MPLIKSRPMLKLARGEGPVLVIWIAAGLLIGFGDGLQSHATSGGAVTIAVLIGLIAIIIWGAFGVVRHADPLALRLGEPYGTLILTAAVTVIEATVIVSAMGTAESASPLARDSAFAVLMIMFNGIVGLCLLLGGLKHREQSFNAAGTQAFLSVALPLSVFALVLPNFTTSTPGPTLSHAQAAVLAMLILALYGVFLTIQTVRHRGFFQDVAGEDSHRGHGSRTRHSTPFHVAALLLTLTPLIFVTESLGKVISPAVAAISAPEAVAGVIAAALVLAPESGAALHAALGNRLQRAVNIALGSALATIGLTMPVVLLVSVWRGQHVTLGLKSEEMVLLLTTLLMSALTFNGARTNVLQGAVHVVMFLVFILLLFDP
jgi:Ca2+:H+ antiporter